jgi:hypothetical protein
MHFHDRRITRERIIAAEIKKLELGLARVGPGPRGPLSGSPAGDRHQGWDRAH